MNDQEKNIVRAEIIVQGLVQGVGFRYFVLRKAHELPGLNGYVKNLPSGEVLTVIEGEKYLILELFEMVKIGPRSSSVKRATIEWGEAKNEFNDFEVRL